MTATILFIDTIHDDDRTLTESLHRLGHRVVTVFTMEEGLAFLARESAELIVTTGGETHAQTLAGRLAEDHPDLPAILVAREGQVIEPRGNLEVLDAPTAARALRTAVNLALEACGLPAGQPAEAIGGIVGESPTMLHMLDLVRAVAPTSATILIEGESGTGKELLVRAVHENGPRAEKPFVAVNCAALPEGLVESTLFGHERGAFTGANQRYLGAFERAQGGTLLLDEISEMRVDLQAKLLRAIQEKQIERVGGDTAIPIDVRVVATTNRDLEAEVRAGRFRADLFYRLRVVPMRVPALRERREDIPLLVNHFLARTSGDLGIPAPSVPDSTLAVLTSRDWPGNVRELEHAVERAVILNREGPLRPGDFLVSPVPLTEAPVLRSTSQSAPMATASVPEDDGVFNLKVMERRMIERALQATDGHRTKAAMLLGISDRTLRNKLNTRPMAA